MCPVPRGVCVGKYLQTRTLTRIHTVKPWTHLQSREEVGCVGVCGCVIFVCLNVKSSVNLRYNCVFTIASDL